MEMVFKIFKDYNLTMAFMMIGIVMYLSYFISRNITKNRIHGSAIAIIIGLILAYIGGTVSGGHKGLASIGLFSGIGLMGGAMLRDYAIVSTAFGARFEEIKKAGLAGAISLFVGVVLSFVIGVIIAVMFGYTGTVDAVTIGAGAVTFIVGPVTGVALGASSAVIALSIAAGVTKAILVMILTPVIGPVIGLNTPKEAMVYGGLMGTTSGTAAGLAAYKPELVPYGALTATFYTGLGCLLCPSILFFITKAILG